METTTDPTVRWWVLPGLDSGRTQRIVEELAQLYGNHPMWRWWVIHHIVRPAGVPEHDDEAAARAVHAWWRDHIRFQAEPGEQVQTPARTVLWGYGDCEDLTGGICSCLEALRIPWRTELLGDPPYHIWPQALVGGRWAHLETAHSRARFDEHPEALLRRVSRLRL